MKYLTGISQGFDKCTKATLQNNYFWGPSPDDCFCLEIWSQYHYNKKSLLNCVPCVLKVYSRANMPYVLMWSRVKMPCVLTCSRAYMLCMLTCSCANVPCVLTCSCANVPCVLTCQRALHAYVLTCERVLRAYVLMCLAAIKEILNTK